MLRNTKVRMAAVLAVGTLLGYLAASGKLNPFSWANAAPSSAEQASARPAESGGGENPACCEGVSKGELLALAGPKGKNAYTSAQKNDKKPNILFIMGDDIGWFNIGAYH